MAKRIVEYLIPPGFVDGTKRSIKQRWSNGNFVRFRDGRLRPIGGWQPLPLTSDSAAIDSAIRGAHQWRNNIGVGNVALGTKGAGGTNYGQLYVAEINTSPAVATDTTAAFTAGSADFLTSAPTKYEVGAELVSASNIAANTIVLTVGTTDNGSGQFTITMSNAAESGASSSVQSVTITPQFSRQKFLNITPPGYQAAEVAEFRPGYGYSTYGGPGYEYNTTFSGSGTVSFSKASHFTLDNFGETLVGTHSSDKGVFQWTNTVTGSYQAKEITTANGYTEAAPSALAVLVSQERHLICLGAGGDTRKVQWSSQETVDVWTPSATNTAGDYPLQTTGNLVCGRRVANSVLIWTDIDTHQMDYLGAPLVYGFKKISDSSGVLSPYAIHSGSEITAWLNRSGFWVYDGYVKPLDCPIKDRVMRTVDWTQESLIFCGSNSQFSELIWWCPSVSGTPGRCTYYVAFNFREGIWYDSLPDCGIARNSWQDKDVLNAPIAVDPSDNTIYQHEATAGDQTEVGFAESGAIDIQTGERFTRVSKVYTDTEQALFGDVNIQFFTSDSAEATETQSALIPVESDGVVDVRLQGRQLRLKIQGSLKNDFTVGATRLEQHAGGRR